ncbi:acyl-CoA thioesterase [Novosphingobium resinovorum]|uniref:Acyl-CoA thioesterase II n=1 Tax=Novosphingobium resinovorum TaxID=158500 RepID=A0A031JWB2_9SPHN|nr:acyl-CoA thioesterase domain-containing protein [Novosphingobium resinovorum]AOR79937.1 acyl-CoA thioesterase II [Novosphingobium resinovorum]EZP81189.1 Acyl-CoA thioesterase II [Novosphingobium resinovorum]
MHCLPDTNPYIDDPELERRLAYAFEKIAPDHYRVAPVPSDLLRLYGGMALSQCLAAARLTVPQDKVAHSLHAYFLQPGLIDRPVEFAVTRESDGRTFANRTVRMTQDGAPILNLMASFKAPEPSGRHGFPMPDVPEPEGLTSLAELVAQYGDRLPERHRPFWRRRQQIDWRPIGMFPFDERDVRPATRSFWFRLNDTIDGPLDVHQRLLAYASDLHIFHTALGPLGIGWANDFLQSSSLDHAIWFHDDFRVDEWMLYAMDSPAATDALALGRGNIFRRDGTLVATVSQQGLARMLDQKREGKL